MKSVYFFILFSLAVISCTKENTVTDEVIDPVIDNPDPVNDGPNLLLQLAGTQIVDANKTPVYLQGVAFGNEIWNNTPLPANTHHTEIDFERVKNMGMNAIRFYMNYRTFEDDANPYIYKQTGWDWLDENIAWAKKNDVYLILNMHAPQGGYQSQGDGDALWDSVENQNRLAALWKAIAERYKDEVQIAGYGPVNEPVPNSSMSQWTALAQKLINEIRSVDKHHLLFIERAIYVKGNVPPDANLNFPDVKGENLVFEFHGYDPYLYTHQLLDFAQIGDGGNYPNENILEVVASTWYTATFNNPAIESGTNDWKFFEGDTYKITDDNIKIGIPALVGASTEGKVYFDDIIIKEYNENGVFTRNIVEMNLNTLKDWNFWSRDDSGSNGLSTTVGHNDSSSIFIQSTTDDSNLSNFALKFIPKPNYSYQMSGWMKGDAIGSDANCKLRLDFHTTDSPILTRNKEYLESVVNELASWAQTKNVPLYMGEFGAGYPCFQDDKGGLQFVRDMVDIVKEKNIHFTYHAYHENSFGIYLGYGTLPDPSNVNQPLIDLFTTILN